jgi:predicted P-loop ATPase
VLFATTNPGEKASYLKDKTGNRRFWPVRTSEEIDLHSLKRDRDQLWAEAVHRHKAGESLLLPKHLWDFATAEQEKRVAQHPWVAILDEAFHSRRTTYDMTDLGETMKKLGWEHTRLRLGSDGKRFYVYVRGAPPYREITVTARFGDKPIIRYAKEAAEEEY